MNLITRQIYGNKKGGAPNTFIGGVASAINTSALLATKLAIDVSRITGFSVVGSDIKCKITGSYGNVFFGPNGTASGLCTFYNDIDGLVTSISQEAFKNTPIKFVHFKNLITCGTTAFVSCTSLQYIYMPNCTALGTSVGLNDVFASATLTNIPIYVNPFLQTCNAGGEDGDIASARTNQGGKIRFVTNFTAPNSITTLALGTVYNTAVQLNFTAPISTNAIDYYECYADGVLKNRIKASGEYIAGLTASTSYNFTIIAVDVFYNKSVVSNTVTASTNTTSAVPTTGLVSYYKLESSSIDSIGINNGADTSISYSNGRVSNAAVLNGISSKVLLGNNASLQLSNVSISCWIKSTNAGSGDRGLMFKRYAYNLFFYGGKLATYSYGSPAGYKDTGINICDGNWRHIVLTQQSGVTNGTKIYLDGSLVLITTVAQTAQTDQLEIGTIGGGGFSNFSIDEASVYNSILTESQIQLLYNNGNGTTL